VYAGEVKVEKADPAFRQDSDEDEGATMVWKGTSLARTQALGGISWNRKKSLPERKKGIKRTENRGRKRGKQHFLHDTPWQRRKTGTENFYEGEPQSKEREGIGEKEEGSDPSGIDPRGSPNGGGNKNVFTAGFWKESFLLDWGTGE